MTTTNFSIRRAAGLTRWNAVLLSRNRLALVYASVMPLLPLLLLLTGDRGAPAVGAGAITTMFLVAGLFPVYYNILSQFVSRRDELLLKRMRTGATRDSELLISIAVPGVLTALFVCVIAVPVAAALGQSLPVNALVYAAAAVGAIAMFTAFAFWTAAWTRNAEAAQLTSLPIILIASVGPLGSSLTGTLRDVVSWTPGAAMSDLIRAGWFGLDGSDAKESTLTFSEAFGQTAEPLAVMMAWTIVAIVLARRAMRWEPRS